MSLYAENKEKSIISLAIKEKLLLSGEVSIQKLIWRTVREDPSTILFLKQML